MSWLDSPVNDRTQPCIRKQPGRCRDRRGSSITQNQLSNCLETDSILLSPSIEATLLALIFSHDYRVLEASMTACLIPAPCLKTDLKYLLLLLFSTINCLKPFFGTCFLIEHLRFCVWCGPVLKLCLECAKPWVLSPTPQKCTASDFLALEVFLVK